MGTQAPAKWARSKHGKPWLNHGLPWSLTMVDHGLAMVKPWFTMFDCVLNGTTVDHGIPWLTVLYSKEMANHGWPWSTMVVSPWSDEMGITTVEHGLTMVDHGRPCFDQSFVKWHHGQIMVDHGLTMAIQNMDDHGWPCFDHDHPECGWPWSNHGQTMVLFNHWSSCLHNIQTWLRNKPKHNCIKIISIIIL